MAALLLRRALVASASPLSTQYPTLPRPIKSSSSFLLRSPLFASHSSSSADGETSDPVSYHNIAEKIDDEIRSYSNELPLPRGFPFDELNTVVKLKKSCISRRYGNECIFIQFEADVPSALIDVDIKTKSVEMSAVMSAKLDELNIHELTLRDKDGEMGDYMEYLHNKGLTPKAISILYQLLESRK